MQEGLITNVVVEFRVLELLALAGTLGGPLLQGIRDHCRNQVAGLHVAGITPWFLIMRVMISVGIILIKDNYIRTLPC